MDCANSENDEIFKIDIQLIKGIIEEKFLIVIGSGVSESAKVISSSALTNALYLELKLDLTKNGKTREISELENVKNDLKKVSQKYQDFYRENKAKQKARELILSSSKTANLEIFKNIAKLPICDIVTTNFDHLIENNQNRLNYKKIVEKACVLSEKPNKTHTNIFKMHGDLDDLDSMVLCQSDYDEYENQHPHIVSELKRRFEENSLLVLGYSANDDNFRKVFSKFRKDFTKQIYWVKREKTDFIESEWPAVNFIEMDVSNFLDILIDEINRYSNENPIQTMNIPKIPDQKTDQNPFKFFKTDSLPSSDFATIAKFFVEPMVFSMLIEPGTHTIVEGDRGSGKSMMLRYISLETQLSLPLASRHTNFIGFYIKMDPGLIETAKKIKSQDLEHWINFFTHFLNLLITERIIDTLILCRKKTLITVNPDNEEKLCGFIVHRLLSNKQTIPKNFDQLLTLIIDDREKMATIDLRSSIIPQTSPRYTYELVKHLEEFDLFFSDKSIYLLLDEVDNLDDDQMEVLVLFLRSRDAPISYKIGVKSNSIKLVDPYGKALQHIDDYEHVYSDRFIKEQKNQVFKFYEDLANNRLYAYEYQIKIKDLLPRDEGDQYTGFKGYCYLSSGIIRSYITLIKDTVYRAYPQINRSKVELLPIPPKRQHQTIKIKSNIHFNEYGKCEHPYEVKKLIEILGSLFKEILKLSRERIHEGLSKELRTVSQIEIKDFNEMDPIIKQYLNEAVKHNLLQIPLIARQQEVSSSPYHGYKIHRLLIPYFLLELPNRFPRTINAKQMNIINDIIRGNRHENDFINPIIKELNFSEEDSYPKHLREFDYGDLDDSEPEL